MLSHVTRVLDAQARRQETSDQDDPAPLVDELKDWLAGRMAVPGETSDCLLSEGDVAELWRCMNELSKRVLRWAPKYACFVEVVDKNLRVVALTDWDDGILMEKDRQMVLSSMARGHRVLEVKFLPSEEPSAVMARFNDLLKQCENLKGSKTMDDGRRVAHHKTPAFAWTVLIAAADGATVAAEALDLNVGHTSGFRDVGQHSGAAQPSTRWALLIEGLKHVIGVQDGEDLVSRLEAELTLCLVENSGSVGPDLALARLKLAESRAKVTNAVLLERRARLVSRLRKVKDIVEGRLKCISHQNVETDDEKLTVGMEVFDASDLLTICSSASSSDGDCNPDATAIEALASAGIPPPSISSGLDRFKKWCLSSSVNNLLALDRIQHKMVELALKFLAGRPEDVRISETDTQLLCDLAARFKHLAGLHAKDVPQNGGALCCMSVELSSRVALVYWITYALVFGASCRLYRALSAFSPALNPIELSKLILPELRAQTALKLVDKFLNSARCRGPEVLGGVKTQQATYDFALALADTLPSVQAEAIRQAATQNAMIDKHWANVKEVKVKLARYREMIKQNEIMFLEASARWDRAPSRSNLERAARRDKDRAQSEKFKYLSLSQNANAPIKIILDLPYATDALHAALALGSCCPAVIQQLCKIGAEAKETTNKREQHVALKLSSMFKGTYSSLWATGKQQWWGDELNSLDEFSSRLDGVLFYNGDQLQKLAGKTAFDVHYARELRTFEDPADGSLPVAAPSICMKRGNLVIARPVVNADGGLPNKEACQAMWSVRADPLQQPRKIIDLLRNTFLPLGSREWILVAKHALFQVGPLDNGRFTWRKDWQEDSVEVLREALRNDLRTLSSRQSDRDRLVFITQIAAYFGQWHVCVRAVARDCGRQAMEWSAEIREDFQTRTKQGGFEDMAQQALRAEEYMCLGTAVLSHGYGNVDKDDVGVLAAASARMACCLALASRDAKRGKAVVEMRCAVSEVLARQASLLDNSDAASAAADAALNELIPSKSWTQILNLANVWRCKVVGGVVHVCTLTGIVLRNSAPPGQLPVTILSSDMYKRSFAGFLFDVVPGSEANTYKALYLEGDEVRYYFTAGEYIKIEEKQECNNGRQLELIGDSTLDLPPRIKMATSAWKAPLEGEAVLRGVRYWDRDVVYICSTEGELYRVPQHVSRPDWRGLSWGPREVLMTGSSTGRCALSRFEDLKFVHSFRIDDTNRVEHNLVRYGLRFVEHGALVYSLDWPDWSLCTGADVALGTLHGVTQFLLLRKQKRCKVLLPNGKVLVSEDTNVVAEVTGAAFKDETKPWEDLPFLTYHEYDKHRRFQSLVATSRAGLLQLAVLYTASELHLRVPDVLERRHGTVVALELLHQVDFVSPLTVGENRSLQDLLRIGWFAPSLWEYVDRMQQRFTFLNDLWKAHDNIEPDAGIHGEASTDKFRPRNRAVARSVRQPVGQIVHHSRGVRAPRTLQSAADKAHELADELEELLGCFVQTGTSLAAEGCTGEYIVGQADLHRTELGKQLLEDMQLSYQANRERSPPCLASSGVPVQDISRVREQLLSLEKEFSLLSRQPDDSVESAIAIASTVYVEPTWRALMRAVCGQSLEAWPELHVADEHVAVRAAQAFARLCVLEDRLIQINDCIKRGDDAKLLRELRCQREWDLKSFPVWLAFEAEQGIRIWPEQYNMAKALLDGKGNVLAQLNVGMGKSSVILPMLLLHFASCLEAKKMVRLHLLPTMLDETCATLARSVGQCAVGCTLFVLPYCRSSARFNGISRVERFEDEMRRSPRAVLCTTPDWRLSHELTMDELGISTRKMRSFINILDESDLLLHYRYELVYALGSSKDLPDYRTRVEAVQALLMLITKPPDGSSIHTLLQNERLVVQAAQEGSVRLCRDAPDDLVRELQRELAFAVILGDYRPSTMKGKKHELVESCPNWVYNSKAPAPDMSSVNACLNATQAVLLVLRGLLAGGILVQCLKEQHRVTYGIPRGQFARAGRDLAVPWRASESPSLRADFVQPECQLVFTHIAHYQDGLPNRDLLRAIRELLNLGPTAQEVEFKRWRESIIAASDCKIVSPRMFDINNPTQLKEIEPYFARNRAVINFWLRVVVLPGQTQQFSEQRSKSAWDLLGESSRTVGFAGTNDIKPLLPLDICEVIVEDESVKATNAVMVERIRSYTVGVSEYKKSNLSSLVEYATRLGCRALIDAGGLLAGVSTREIATAILKHHDAVTIFSIDQCTWMVYFKSGRVLTRSTSPMPEAETFAVFDQGRCRGADLKLQSECCALLTLGPKITKAELVQAAGRMRGLGQGQKLCITATSDVWHSLKAFGNPNVTAVEVIAFTQANTITSQRSGLTRWAAQGKNSAMRQVQKCKFKLLELYERNQSAVTAMGESTSQLVRNRFAQIDRRQGRFMRDGEVLENEADAECERELEHEKQNEEENELEIEVKNPRTETFIINSAGNLCSADWLTMSEAVRRFLPRFSTFIWPSGLYCTLNFIKATAESGLCTLENYLRTVDMVMVLSDKRVVLISSREAEQLLSADSFEFAIANWLTVRASLPSTNIVRMSRGTCTALVSTVLLADAEMMAAISFFASEGKLPVTAHNTGLSRLVRNVRFQDQLFNWFKLRTKHSHFAESDAEDAFMRRAPKEGLVTARLSKAFRFE